MASNNNRSAIRQAYSEYLGREASASEVDGWVSGRFHGGGINDWLNAIRNSGEAKDYAARPKTPQTDPTPPTTPTVPRTTMPIPTGETGPTEDEYDPDDPDSGPPPE